MSRNGDILESNVTRKSSRGEDVESRSESDNAEAVSGDDLDTSDRPLKKKKRYHRHTPKQIQDLESYITLTKITIFFYFYEIVFRF